MPGIENWDRKQLEQEYWKCLKEKEILQSAFNSAYEGIVITDPDGTIRMLNEPYAKFLNIRPEEAVGKHCTEVIENSRMHIVGRTGKAELAQVQRIRGGEMIAHRIPIIEKGKVVAVVGKVLFQDVKELHALSARVNRLRQELDYYKGEYLKTLYARYDFSDIIGNDAKLLSVIEIAKKVAPSNTTVFIGGESGTGKELFAHAIHNHSHRRHGPFVKVNCAAIPESLLESVLFGYEEGAFTGAVKGGKKGKFQMAHQGTIFLDEIGELPLTMQAKLLRVLQEKEVEVVGGVHSVSVDVRVIAASNRDLEQMVANQQFRQDLFYRLHVVALHIPPLRERKGDIPALVDALLGELSQEVGVYVDGVEPAAMDRLVDYHWPGNVRELKNILERALHLKEDGWIRVEHLPYHIGGEKRDEPSQFSLREALERTEEEMIRKALHYAKGDRQKAIKLLGISRSGFYQKLHKYGLLS